MDDDAHSIVSDFELLTRKQAAVLDLLAHGRTSKEIAGILDLSESAVNRRIEMLRSRFGGITRLELARRYRDRAVTFTDLLASRPDCVENDRQKLHLADEVEGDEKQCRDESDIDLAFQDSLKISIEAPWNSGAEPQIVPRVLDGNNAMLTRGAAIAMILVGIIASLVLGLAAALAITEVLGK